MPSCPPLYDCAWTQTIHKVTVPDNGDWSLFWISLIAITAIITVGILIGMSIVVWADTHKEMTFKVK